MDYRDDIENVLSDIKTGVDGLTDIVGDKMNLLNGSFSGYPLQDVFTYQSGAQIFPLDYEALRIDDVFVNMKKLSPAQFSYTYNKITINDTLEAGDVIFVKYSAEANFDQVYGIKKNKTHAAPEWRRVGKNMALHASLPVQSQMKRCLLNDNGKVNYYLDPEDSTKKADGTTATLDGRDGQYMVEIPRHFQRFDTFGDILYVWISLTPFPGSFESPKQYVSAIKAVLHRPSRTLSSVINTSNDYRGGNNQSGYDGKPQDFRGKPVSYLTRPQFYTYAKRRGDAWNMMTYNARKTIAWLITVEFATSNHQAAFTSSTTPEGYRKGALGRGPVNISTNDWSTFNNRYPMISVGQTNALGNTSGEVSISLYDFPVNGKRAETHVNSYRGIENFFGDLWEWTDGVNFKITGGGEFTETFKAIGNAHSDADYDGYKKIGMLSQSQGYIREIIFGPKGDILPANTNGASSTTYFSDYLYKTNKDGLAGVLFCGSQGHNSMAGSLETSANTLGAYKNAGSRLCCIPKK